MTTLTVLLLQRTELEKKLRKNTLHVNQKRAKTVIECQSSAAYGAGCGLKFFIKEVTYIQTHWYEKPSGCSGGDMWHEGEGQFECPCCGHINRLYKRPEIVELKGLFKNLSKEYKE
jgi:hypothetical protein